MIQSEVIMSKKLCALLVLGIFIFLPIMTEPSQAQTKLGDDQIRQIATDKITSIMKSIESQNYDQYSKDFSEKMKSAQKPDDFMALCKKMDSSLGKLDSIDFIGYFIHGNDTIALFKAKYSKTGDDVLVRLVLDLNSPKQNVVGLWFDSPALGK